MSLGPELQPGLMPHCITLKPASMTVITITIIIDPTSTLS